MNKLLFYFGMVLLAVIIVFASLLLLLNIQKRGFLTSGQGIVATVGNSNSSTPTQTTTNPSSEDPTNAKLENLAAEFRSLRKIKGQFSGGSWNEDADSSSGRKHQLMIELERRLVAAAISRKQLIQLLGTPDKTIKNNGKDYDTIMNSGAFRLPKSGSYEFLVYYWRGTHDYLFFVFQEDVVVGSGWMRMLE